jgi:hypothetical protein
MASAGSSFRALCATHLDKFLALAIPDARSAIRNWLVSGNCIDRLGFRSRFARRAVSMRAGEHRFKP